MPIEILEFTTRNQLNFMFFVGHTLVLQTVALVATA